MKIIKILQQLKVKFAYPICFFLPNTGLINLILKLCTKDNLWRWLRDLLEDHERNTIKTDEKGDNSEKLHKKDKRYRM